MEGREEERQIENMGLRPRTNIVTSEEGGGEREDAAEHGDGVADGELTLFIVAVLLFGCIALRLQHHFRFFFPLSVFIIYRIFIFVCVGTWICGGVYFWCWCLARN